MTFDYARARATAARLIASFGQTVTLRKPGATTGPSYDPVPGAPDDYTAKAVDLNRLIRNMNDVTVTAGSRRRGIRCRSARNGAKLPCRARWLLAA